MLLRYIYIFFVAVFLAIFIGVGIAVFYPEPKAPEAPIGASYQKELTPAEQAEMQAFEIEMRAYNQKIWVYNRNVSLISMGCAIVLLVVSLLATKWIGILSNGLLLGGIFTLLYGIGRGMITDDNRYRFLVAAIGLATTLALGYIKFTRRELKQVEQTA